MKKWISVLLVVIMCFSISITSFAVEDIDPVDNNDYSWELENIDGTPSLARWSYTSTTTQAISIKNGTATITASVDGYQNIATKVVMYMYLQQSKNGGWTNLTSYTHTFNTYHGEAEHYYSTCPKGYTYRLRCSYYVYSGSQYEHIIAYSNNYSY